MNTRDNTKKKSMTAKHTPGPWTMHPSPHGAEVRSLAKIAWCGAAARYGKSGDQIIDAAEARANAHLIAAAPDLLAACEALVRSGSFYDLDAKMFAARAAIAKAKGEKP